MGPDTAAQQTVPPSDKALGKELGKELGKVLRLYLL
jgi:hypothetical protein